MTIKNNTTFIHAHGRPQLYDGANGVQRHGAFVITNPDQTKEVLPSNTNITGMVTMVDVTQSLHKGETANWLQVRIDDPGEPTIVLSVGLGSFFAAKFVGLLNAADLSRPISMALLSVLKGEKFDDELSESSNVFPIFRSCHDNARLVPVWANGATKLPEALKVKFNGRMMNNMDPVNKAVGATLTGIYEKLDIIKKAQNALLTRSA